MPKNFEKINDAFECVICGHQNPPAARTCRNHCRACLHSVHVDNVPGDRACDCHGILEPIGVELCGAEWHQIVFRCQKCGKVCRNLVADDDDRDRLHELLKKPLEV